MIHTTIKKTGAQLIEEGKLEEALALYQDTILYNWITSEDKEAFYQLQQIYQGLGKVLWSRAMLFQAKLLEKDRNEVLNFIKPITEEWIKLNEKCLENDENYKVYYDLAYNHILQLQFVEACIYYKLYQYYAPLNQDGPDEVYTIIGEYEYAQRFYSQLENKTHTYIVVMTKAEDEALVRALSKLGSKVYCIMLPVIQYIYPTDYKVENFIEGSLNSIVVEGNIHKIYPIVLSGKEGMLDETIKGILLGVKNRYCLADSWMVIGDKDHLNYLLQDMRLNKYFQKVYKEEVDREWPSKATYLMGNYLYTAKYLYHVDIPKRMAEKPKVKVSIVIPTKNCSYTLKSTLETCLNQDYEDYEIVVSDNSDETYRDTYELVQSFNNPKIKYYRTPYALPLGKSFEYAYLLAQGEFIFSIGSDDGVFPYTVSHIAKLLERYPEENLLLWQRITYIWPELKATGQADNLLFPNKLEKASYPVETEWMFEQIMDHANRGMNVIYSAPLLYINSGMRRRHILEVIRLTGKFLEGSSQDIYTGILNLAMYDHVIYEELPLAISGMSDRSIGAESTVVNHSLKRYKNYVKCYNETTSFVEIPSTPSQKLVFPQYDYTLFYYELLKLYDIGVSKRCEKWKEKIDFRNLFEWLLKDNFEKEPEVFDMLRFIRQSAYAQSESFGAWFDEKLYLKGKRELAELMMEEPEEVLSKEVPKNYPKGVNEVKISFDASELGITNVAQVAEFFMKYFEL